MIVGVAPGTTNSLVAWLWEAKRRRNSYRPLFIVQAGTRASALRRLAWPGLTKAAAFFSVHWYVKGGRIECCCVPFRFAPFFTQLEIMRFQTLCVDLVALHHVAPEFQ